MKLDTIFLAEAATIRDGLIHVLGGYMSYLNRPEFPAPFGASLVVVLEPSKDDVVNGVAAVSFKVSCEYLDSQEPSPEIVFEGEGNLQGEGEPPPGATMPLVLDLQSIQLPGPGDYKIDFELDGTVAKSLRFVVA